MKWFLLIPAALGGSILGILLFGLVPGVIFSIVWWGAEADKHLELLSEMLRPGAILGCFTAIGLTSLALWRTP
jgi:hypothetical protein